MEAFQFFNFFKQRLCIFCQKLSNENKQRLYKIQKSPTRLFYHVLLIKQNECTRSNDRKMDLDKKSIACKCSRKQIKVQFLKPKFKFVYISVSA